MHKSAADASEAAIITSPNRIKAYTDRRIFPPERNTPTSRMNQLLALVVPRGSGVAVAAFLALLDRRGIDLRAGWPFPDERGPSAFSGSGILFLTTPVK